jgi:hypothetical protein
VLSALHKSKRRDLSIGVVAAFLFAIAVLLFVGAGYLFQKVHVVPDNAWGKGFWYRFWGGPGLLYHPNSIAGVGVLIAMRIGADKLFRAEQRVAAVALAAFLVVVTNSRTGFFFLAAAALGHAVLLLWRSRAPQTGVPQYRRRWVAVAVPFVALAMIPATSGGVRFLTQERYGSDAGVTSGRWDTWMQVLDDWEHASVAEKAFGDAKTVRSTVYRQESGADIKLTVDNAAFGALRHGGVVGVLAFLVGLFLLLFNLWRRRDAAPGWLALTSVAALPTIATTEWLLGGTGGVMWILLVTGEAYLLTADSSTVDSEPSPAPVPDAAPV